MQALHEGALAERPVLVPARRLADYAAILDFAGRLATAVEERVVVDRLAGLCASLFAPEVAVFVPVVDGVPRAPVTRPVEATPDPADLVELTAFVGRSCVASDGRSLLARIGDPSPLGLLRLSRVAFPELAPHYVESFGLVAEATALALLHARSHHALRETEHALRVERDELEVRVRERTAELERTVAELRETSAHLRVLHGLLPICCSCKKVRDDGGCWRIIEEYLTQHSEATFTHGLCPDCVDRLYPELGGADGPPTGR